MKCPNCSYERQKLDNAPEWQCPSCNIAYNKYHKYRGNNYYSIILTYRKRPDDAEIKAENLSLYLIGDLVEGALLNSNGEIERIRLADNELGKHAHGVKQILNNPLAVLSAEQEDAIFRATATIINKQAHKLYEVKKQKNRNKKLTLLLVYLTIITTITTFFYVISDTVISPINHNFVNAYLVTKNYSNNIFPSANTKLNLELIDSKLHSADILTKQCHNMCQSGQSDYTACVKANEILSETSIEINKYQQYIQENSVDKMDSRSKRLIDQINHNLWNIPRVIESAINLCQRPTIQEVRAQVNTVALKPQVEKFDFMLNGINLSILYSKIYTANNHIRECRLNCMAGSKIQTGCSIFIVLQKEYKSDVEKLFRLMQNHSLNKYSDEISVTDKKYIEEIFALLRDIEEERKKIIECINSL